MKLLVLIVGNAVVLLGLGRWLLAQYRLPELRRFLWPTLVLRLLAGVISTLRPTDDARYFMIWARRFVLQLWTSPGAWGHTLGSDAFYFGRWKLVFHGYSNTLFFIKALSVLELLAGGSFLITALYLSVASFVGSWVLVRVLSLQFPGTRGAAVSGLLLWPSAVYWSSGITKESLLLTGSSLLVAGGVTLLYGRPGRRFGWVLLTLLGAWLSFKMRFFFGGALVAMLLCLTAVHLAQQLVPGLRRRWQLVLFVGLLVAGAQLAGEVSPVFRFNKFASQLTRTYGALRNKSLNRPHVALPDLSPTPTSILQHTPKAVASALFRPFAWEGDSVFYGLAALENLGLLVLALLACWDVARGREGPLPTMLVVTLLLYCLLLAALLGLSTPNLGTLSRYRSPWLPLLIYVLMSQPTVGGWVRRLRILEPVTRWRN